MTRKITLAVALIIATVTTSRADEGMWLPSLIGSRIVDMQEKGFKLDAEDIYSINQASLKDAVVLFGGGCTGEIVSEAGLLLTNHHCGYRQIQSHSSVEHDYLRDGFWAMDTLAFGCNLPTIRAVWGLAPVRVRSCWANNRVGGKRKFSSYFRFPTSHTTVRAVRHTAVPYTLCN